MVVSSGGIMVMVVVGSDSMVVVVGSDIMVLMTPRLRGDPAYEYTPCLPM